MIPILEKLFTKKLKTYKSCKTIYMENFYNILDGGDLRWLIMGFDENSEMLINQKQESELNDLWKEIFNEYILLKGDKKIIDNLRKKAQIADLQNRLYWGSTLLKLIYENPMGKNLQELVDRLAFYKFKIHIHRPLGKEIEKITKQLKSLRTRINMEVNRFKKKMEKYEKQEKVGLRSQTVKIARILDMKYPIDPKTTVMEEWVYLCKDAEKEVKRQNKRQDG